MLLCRIFSVCTKITKQYLDFNGLNLYNEYVFSKIKQSDWSINNPSDPRYVENRTHWVGDPELVTIIEETTAEINSYVSIPEIEFVAGQVYFVNWNGTEYECTAWNNNYERAFLGNGNIYGGEGKGEDVPFCFEKGWVNVAEAGTYTFSIATEARKYYPIDERFLPPVIGRPGMGENAEVFNNYSENIASGKNSHAEGDGTNASGDDSHAEGNHTFASGLNSHAEGSHAAAFGNAAHAEGSDTTASGDYSHAEGEYTAAFGRSSHAEGGVKSSYIYLTGSAGSNTYVLVNNDTITVGDYVHCFQYDSYAIVEDYNPSTKTITLSNTLSSDDALNKTSTRWMHGGIAYGEYSHIEGLGTKANSDCQHVQGKYNIADTENKYAHIVGNGVNNGGVDDTRSNAHTIDWEGNAWFAGKIYAGGTGQDDEAAIEVALKTDIAQPNWNQNDETAADYVKNRTHYEYLDDANLVLPISTINCNTEGTDWGYVTDFEAHYLGTLPTSIDLDSSDVFTVFLDGQYYECIPDPIWSEEGIPIPEAVIVGACIGGNLGNAFGDVYSMEPELPFAICGDTIAVYEQGEHTVAVWKGAKSVKKLDSKYLNSEEWVFTLEDGSTVTKKVVLG